jgi:hypothetical protein
VILISKKYLPLCINPLYTGKMVVCHITITLLINDTETNILIDVTSVLQQDGFWRYEEVICKVDIGKDVTTSVSYKLREQY